MTCASPALSATGCKLRLLLVEDSPDDAELVLRELHRSGFDVSADVVQTPEEFVQRIQDNQYDFVLADYNLPQWCGIEALQLMRDHGIDTSLILVTGSLGDEKAVECLKLGAADFVLKDRLGRLPVAIRSALKERQLREERERAEAALRDSETRLASIIASAMDAIIAVDQDQCVVMFNAAAEEMFRCPADEAIGQPLDRFIPERYRAGHKEHHRRFSESGFTARSLGKMRALTALRADGEEFQAEISISQSSSRSKRISTAIVRDVSDRKRAETELALKAEELARSNRDLEQFAYIASHDLQEPLRMVAAYTQLLAERYQGKLDQSADKYIAYAVEGATRMQTLIHDLLAFARVGKNGNGPQEVDCTAILEDAVKNLQASIQESGAVITHGTLPLVRVDRSQFGQLFQNLVGNALKFRGADAPIIRVSADLHSSEWVFAVSDNGIGIAPEHKERIFDIGQRLHTRTEYPGNGVGLAICKKIVEQHGGRIWVDSQPGQGSTFRFTWPIQPERER